MAWCHQAPNHYLSQCWHISLVSLDRNVLSWQYRNHETLRNSILLIHLQIQMMRSLYNYAHGITTRLSWHVQEFVVLRYLVTDVHQWYFPQNKNFMENHWWSGPKVEPYAKTGRQLTYVCLFPTLRLQSFSKMNTRDQENIHTLTHFPLVPQIYISEMCLHWFT